MNLDRAIAELLAHPIWDRVVYRNSIREYVAAVVVVAVFAVVGRIYAGFLSRRLRVLAARTETVMDDCLLALLDRATTPILVVTSLFALANILHVPAIVGTIARWLFLVTVTYYAITSFIRVLDAVLAGMKNREGAAALDPSALHHARLMTRIVVWVVGFLLILRNLGYDVTSLMAGFGIAGIAVALAVQNILGDLFSYISLLVDKPFEIGDFVIVGTDSGTVEHIGIRSTRLRTLQGQELVVANADLTSARINNFKKMTRRRVVGRLGVVYGTSPEKLRAIPVWIAEALSVIPGVQVDRVHFQALGASSLDFEYAFYVESGQVSVFMDVQQEFNLRIYEKFREEGVEFAFPTQTIHVEGVAPKH